MTDQDIDLAIFFALVLAVAHLADLALRVRACAGCPECARIGERR